MSKDITERITEYVARNKNMIPSACLLLEECYQEITQLRQKLENKKEGELI